MNKKQKFQRYQFCQQGINLEEDDPKKLEQDGDKNNSRRDESVASNRNLSHFAVNNVKKPNLSGETTLNDQLNDMKNLSAINLRKVAPLQRSDTQKSLAQQILYSNYEKLFLQNKKELE